MSNRPAVLRVPPSETQVRDLALMLRARHPLLVVDTLEEERLGVLLEQVARSLSLHSYEWMAHRGIVDTANGDVIKGTEDPDRALDWIARVHGEAVFHLRGFGHALGERTRAARLRELHHDFFSRLSVIVLSGDVASLPPDIETIATPFNLTPLTDTDYHKLVSAVIRDVRQRMKVDVLLEPDDVARLLEHLRGLSVFEVQKVVTEAIADDAKLDADDLVAIRDAKMRVVRRSGVLEYYPHEHKLADIAGLERLKGWIAKRKRAFLDPAAARAFGVTPPRGLLVLGVQGCGKSLAAKAIAHELRLPLVRLDPASLFNKFFGESERNLRRAIQLAEAMAPVVLWIDELEKAFGGVGESGDSGVSQRMFGTFLTWLSDKKENVFVVATANDVSRLPPELVRKGRFDEMFFVDLPTRDARAAVFRIHLVKRDRDPASLDVDRLADATEGWSGAEIEAVVVAALHHVFSTGEALTTEIVLGEIAETRPLSATMREKMESLRAWARERATPAV